MVVSVPQERAEDRPVVRTGVPGYITQFEVAWDKGEPTREQVSAFFQDVVNNHDERHLAERERRVLANKRAFGELK